MIAKQYAISKDSMTPINNIVRKYGKYSSNAELSKIGENYGRFYGVSSDCIWMEINFDAKNNTFEKPLEVNAIFESLLYMKDNDRLKDIAAVNCCYRHKLNIDNAATADIIITVKEFEKYYDKLKDKSKTNEELAAELATLWMEYNPYNRYELVLDREYEYRKKLMTIWKHRLYFSDEIVNDQKVSAVYVYEKEENRLFFSIEEYDQVNKFFTSEAADNKITFAEEGYLYGAWDENKNFWVYGKRCRRGHKGFTPRPL